MTSDPKRLGATFDAHTDAEFRTRDIEATMATMADAPHLTHVPTMTGGNGREDVLTNLDKINPETRVYVRRDLRVAP